MMLPSSIQTATRYEQQMLAFSIQMTEWLQALPAATGSGADLDGNFGQVVGVA